MSYRISSLILVLVVVLFGVGGFALFSTGQSKLPQIYYVEYGEGDAQKAGKSFAISPSLEDNLIQYDYVSMTADDFSKKVINKSKILDGHSDTSLRNENWVVEFPAENQAIFQLSINGPDVDYYVAWAMENNIDELYFFTSYLDPDLKYHEAGISKKIFDILNPNQIFEYLLPENAFAATIPGPNCSDGVLRPDGWTRVMFRPRLATSCSADNNGFASFKYTFKYSARSCHTTPMEFYVRENVSDDQGINGLVDCMNDKNPGLYMCNPHDVKIELYKSTSHPEYRCNTSSNFWGCTYGRSTMSPSPFNSFGTIYMRQGKFSSNRWLVRHELQHAYGYQHGSGPGNCSSFGNANYEKTCCQDSF